MEDGLEFTGGAFGCRDDKILEIVFNTSMVGYQEILSDPSYTDQAVVMTYPLIGNYGMAADDYETLVPTIGALIVREYNDEPSNFRSEKTLGEVMAEYGVAGVSGVDTRKLNRIIRNYGSCKVMITSSDISTAEAVEVLKNTELPHDAVSRVSRKQTEKYFISDRQPAKFHVAAIDCGMKQNIVRSLNDCGCDVTVVPWNTPAKVIEELKPDGIFISNGPGDPTDVPEVVETIRELRGKYPIFGICLGLQIISLAYGAKTYKLKFGHRGGNHPVRDLISDKIEITSQNHSYAVDNLSLAGTGLSCSHINLLDGTVEGVRSNKDLTFAVQYHPESAPGPEDSKYLFGNFIDMMEKAKNSSATGGKYHA